MIRRLCILLGCFLFLLQLHTISSTAYAFDFEAKEISNEEVYNFLNNIDLENLYEEPRKNPIACFDVNENGLIALGFDTSPKKSILIYDAKGVFQYGYEFSCSGSFGVLFQNEQLSIYFSKSGYLATFDLDGNSIEVKKILLTAANQEMVRELLYSGDRANGKITYRLERDIGLTERSYSRLVAFDEQGSSQVIYDLTSQHNFSAIISIFFFVLFIIFVVLGTIRRCREASWGE